MEKQPASTNTRPDHDYFSSVQSFEKDAAAAIVPDHAVELDKAAERRVVRKIDLSLIPLMWVGYGLVYYDKVGRNTMSPKHVSLTFFRLS